jgi:hypothetical protein
MKKASEVFKKIRFAKMDPNHEKAGSFSTDDEEHYTVSTKEWEQQVQHVKKRSMQEDLRKWFSKTDPEGGWKRINSKGEAIGPCAREPGEPKPKCMSNEKRASLTKKERASAVATKRKHDPDPERKGAPINVSNFGKGKISEDMENLDEKNVPTSPEKWAQAKSQAKAKFDVYPSAYANGWASKKYKAMGGGWKSVSEESQVDEGAVPSTEKVVTVRHKTSGKEIVVTAQKAKEYQQQGYHQVKEAKEKTEYDYEGDMARGQLQSIINNAQRVHDMLKDNDNLPEWVQSKITLSEDYISTVANYMMSEIDEEVVTEAKKPKPSSLDKFRKASDERDKKHSQMPTGDLKGAVDRLEKHLNKEEVQKADVPAYIRKQRGDTPLTVADVKTPRKDSISAAATLQKMKNEETKPPFDKPYTTTKAVVTDKSGAKHGPMSRARSIARDAMKKQAEKMPVKKSIKESRKSEIVKDIVKKKMDPKDKFQANPTLTSQVQKIDNAVT